MEIDLLLRLCPDDEDTIYQIVDMLVDTCSTKRKMLRIAGDDKPTEVVRSRLKKLNADHIRFVLDSLAENTAPVRNMKQYLLNMVDEKKVSFNPAVELSYLSTEQQQEMINAMDDTQNAPSFSQAKRIKKLAQEGNFTSEAVVDIMGEEKKSELDTVTIKNEILRKYFPRSYTPKQMEEKIIQLLDAWQRKQQRQNER